MKQKDIIRLLKSKLDPLDQVPIEAYEQLLTHLEVLHIDKKQLVRPSHTLEDNAYYLLTGLLAFEHEGRLSRLFLEGHVVYDRLAYQSGRPSHFELKTISKSILVKVSRQQEKQILQKIPAFEKLSEVLLQKAKEADELWLMISQKHYRDAYALLNKYFKGFYDVLSHDLLAQLFQLDKRTISRYNKYMYQIKDSPLAKVKMGEILNYPFYSALHHEPEYITNKVIKWLKENKLLVNAAHIKKFRTYKMTYLALRLYPEAPMHKAIWIGELFAWLFLMDDYTDQLKGVEKLKFWNFIHGFVNAIMHEESWDNSEHYNPFQIAFISLWEEFGKLHAYGFKDVLIDQLLKYIESNIWEAKNKAYQIIPNLDEYLKERPYFSGGNLALELIPLGVECEQEKLLEAWKQLAVLRKLAAEMIYISNDILSYQKEHAISDFHNWVALLMHHQKYTRTQAIDSLLQRHNQVLQTFEIKMSSYFEQYRPENRVLLSLIKNLKFQVSGALTWSVEDTKRYLPEKAKQVLLQERLN
ncbi:terpene synthase family protein [Belliella kenyensis]|uniref:Terpene synthase n=1 Tax=Belliella kenyensis TaxID=1472724 RepID=A0ABV8ENK7_9BACT|nr:terpene synthase family protein [Belliella kenyensis]MCH7400871.1 terpene synthase family protein [Belliella kenyensis]MDN3601842.1 terpene synthase family protein [Belliella kenyensis]